MCNICACVSERWVQITPRVRLVDYNKYCNVIVIHMV